MFVTLYPQTDILTSVMSWIDIILVILLVGALTLGYGKGLIRQIASLGGVILGIIAVWVAGGWATDIAARLIGADQPGASAFSYYSASVIGCGLLFIAVWFGVWLLGHMLSRTFHALKMGPLDRVLGSLFMLFKWTLVISLLLNLWKVIQPGSALFSASKIMGGKFLEWIIDFSPWLMGYMKEAATNYLPSVL